MTQLLTDKHAVIYGGGGRIGAAVAKLYAAQGAHVHLAGRSPEALNRVAAEIGPAATTTVLDATDEDAVEAHIASLPHLDVSFNLISRGDVHGHPLTELSTADFMAPIVNGLTANFITARAAARRMSSQEPSGGVILWIGSGSATGAGPQMGGTGPADAATDNLMRQLAREAGAHNIRVCGIWTAGVPETFADGRNPTSLPSRSTRSSVSTPP
jgi:NAD(P)-dependent dehydrogenase (short-subunit alcohol dehydrogenase family)